MGIHWDSPQQKEREFAYIKELIKCHMPLKEGIKISRKYHAEHITHSFLVIPQGGNVKIYAMGSKSEPEKGHLAASIVKLIENEEGVPFAVKIFDPVMLEIKKLRGAVSPISEFNFLSRLGRGVGFFTNVENKKIYMLQNLAEGQTLEIFVRKRQDNKEGLDLVTAIDILQKILIEIVKLEEKGIYHRDLHPKNIFISNVENVKQISIIDFDFAKENEDVNGGQLFSNFNSKLYATVITILAEQPILASCLPFSILWDSFSWTRGDLNSLFPTNAKNCLLLFNLSLKIKNIDTQQITAHELNSLVDYINNFSTQLKMRDSKLAFNVKKYFKACHLLFMESVSLLRHFSPQEKIEPEVLINYLLQYPAELMQPVINDIIKISQSFGNSLDYDQIWEYAKSALSTDPTLIFNFLDLARALPQELITPNKLNILQKDLKNLIMLYTPPFVCANDIDLTESLKILLTGNPNHLSIYRMLHEFINKSKKSPIFNQHKEEIYTLIYQFLITHQSCFNINSDIDDKILKMVELLELPCQVELVAKFVPPLSENLLKMILKNDKNAIIMAMDDVLFDFYQTDEDSDFLLLTKVVIEPVSAHEKKDELLEQVADELVSEFFKNIPFFLGLSERLFTDKKQELALFFKNHLTWKSIENNKYKVVFNNEIDQIRTDFLRNFISNFFQLSVNDNRSFFPHL